MEISNVEEAGIEREMPPAPAPKPLHPRNRGDAGKRKRARAPPKKEAKKMPKTRAKAKRGAAPALPRGKKRTVFPLGGAKVGIAVPPNIARELRQYRAKLESKSGDRVTMAEAVGKAVRIAGAGLR
jgi:hypothetical protein